jgi:hypothetical protein
LLSFSWLIFFNKGLSIGLLFLFTVFAGSWLISIIVDPIRKSFLLTFKEMVIVDIPVGEKAKDLTDSLNRASSLYWCYLLDSEKIAAQK